MGTVKDKAALDAALADNTSRLIEPADIRDLAASMSGAYGHMALSHPEDPPGTPVTHTCNNAWQTFAEWTTSRDNSGLAENLTTGEFTVQPGAAGQYETMASISFSVDTTGTFRFRPRGELANATEVAMGADSARVEDLTAGDVVTWNLIGLNLSPDEIDEGGKLYLQVRGPNSAKITPLHGWFRCERKLKA